MLLDHTGRPMDRPRKQDLADEVSAPDLGSVRQIVSGHPADGLTPYRLGSILREAEIGDATAYLELGEQFEEKDLHYAAVLGVRKRAIRKLTLQVEAGGDAQADLDAAELVRRELNKPAIRLNLVNWLDGLGKGYSVAELIWNTTGDHWTIAKVKHRDPRWFRFDQETGQELMLRTNEGERRLPPFKFVVHIPEIKSGLPIRGGLARLAAWGYIFKNYTLKDWAIFLEGFGHPIRLGKYGPNASAEDRAALLRAVRAIGTDMAAIFPKSMELDLQEVGVSGTTDSYERKARYWDEQYSKAILGQVSTTDAIAGGHAVGKVHAEVREDIRDADAEQLAATLQRDLAVPLTWVNFGERAVAPEISFVSEEEHDPRLLISAAQTFGAWGLKIPKGVLHERFGIRDPEDDEEVLSAPTLTPPPLVATTAAKTGEVKEDPEQTGLDSLLTAAMNAAPRVTDPMLDGFFEALQGAQTLEEARDILDELTRAGPDETLREFLAQIMGTARLAGELGAA